MKFSKRLLFIIGGVVAIVALALCLLLPKDATDNPNVQATNPSGNEQIYVPTGPTTPGGNTDPTTPAEGDPYIEKNETEDLVKVPVGDDNIPSTDVSDVGKDKDEEQSVDQGEIRNDEILAE